MKLMSKVEKRNSVNHFIVCSCSSLLVPSQAKSSIVVIKVQYVAFKIDTIGKLLNNVECIIKKIPNQRIMLQTNANNLLCF